LFYYVEEEREDNVSHAPSMAENEHCNNFNQTGSLKETRHNSIITISLSLRLYTQGVFQDLGSWKYDIGNSSSICGRHLAI
jgi:hypothetical protein